MLKSTEKFKNQTTLYELLYSILDISFKHMVIVTFILPDKFSSTGEQKP